MQSAKFELVRLDNTDVIATSSGGEGITVANLYNGVKGDATIKGILNGHTIDYSGNTASEAVITALNAALGSGVTGSTYFWVSDGLKGSTISTLFDTYSTRNFKGGDSAEANDKTRFDMYNVTYVWDAASNSFKYKQ